MTVFREVEQRWRLLVPVDAVLITAGSRRERGRAVAALAPGTPVVLCGGNRLRALRRVARAGGLAVRAEYVALPCLATPVAVTQVTPQALAWMARTVLTVPSGVTRTHLPTWLAVRLVRRWPRLAVWAPMGDRLLVGTRS